MTRSIPNYVCVPCGRGFSTRSAAKRHLMNLEAGNGYVATEAQYRAALVCGTIPPPAPIGIVTPTKKDKKEDLKMIAYRNFYSAFYWRLGEMAAEGLSEADRKAQLALIMMMSNSP